MTKSVNANRPGRHRPDLDVDIEPLYHPNLDSDDEDPNELIDWAMRQQQLMAGREVVYKTKRQLEALEKEQRDARQGLREAVKSTVPDVRAPLFEKLDSLAIEGHSFAAAEVVNLLKATDVPLKDALDYLDLNVAQREDLLDRIGFYRGIIIDNRLSNSVEMGFHDILMREGADPVEGLKAVAPLYRKPVYSGYFENYHTSSEEIHQTQKSGVTNLDYSVSLAFGLQAQVGIGGGTKSHNSQDAMIGSVGKRMYTTANFLLPKIELSYDAIAARASAKFYEECAKAVLSDNFDNELEIRFTSLARVLGTFGHFVAKETLIGGRLFATEVKTFDGKELKSNLVERFASEVKFNLSSIRLDIDGKYENEKSSQTATREQSTIENQGITFHGVGGEGTVVQNASAWAQSLYDYKRWAVIQRENLVPSLNLLPAELSRRCWAILTKYAATQTKQNLFANGFSFMFYGAYAIEAGAKARDVLFSIENTQYDAAIAVESMPIRHGVSATLTKPSDELRQIWRFTEDGRIVSAVEDVAVVRGIAQKRSFALTANVESVNEKDKDSYAVYLQRVGPSDYQIWEDLGSGEITNMGLGKNYVLDAEAGNKLVLRKKLPGNVVSRLWNVIELPDGIKDKLTPKSEGKRWFKLQLEDGTILSLQGAEGKTYLNTRGAYQIVGQPDVNGLHQLWRMTERGEIVSALPAGAEKDQHHVFLSIRQNNKLLVAECYNPLAMQRWSDSVEGTVRCLGGNAQAAVVAVTAASGEPYNVQQRTLELKIGATTPELKIKKALVSNGGLYSKFKLDSTAKNANKIDFGFVSGELEIDGILSSLDIELFQPNTGQLFKNGVYRARLKGTALRNGNPVEAKFINEQTVIDESTFSRQVNQNLIYLPKENIYSIALVIDKIGIYLRYRRIKGGAWFGAATDLTEADFPKLARGAYLGSTVRDTIDFSKSLVAVGLYCSAEGDVLSIKALRNSGIGDVKDIE